MIDKIFSIISRSKIVLTIAMALVLSGCSGDNCIGADDFGFANITISSRYDSDQITQQHGGSQVAPWINSNFTVTGGPLTILVHSWTPSVDPNNSSYLSAWSPWYGTKENQHSLSDFCERLQECLFVDNQMCSATPDAQIGNAPCILRNGIGLYALIPPLGTDPNSSVASQTTPPGLSFHLGEPTNGYQMIDVDSKGNLRQAGGLVYQYEVEGQDADSLKMQYAASRLYFKILDKFYDDNNGQYRISIKSGVFTTNQDPLTYMTNLVTNFLFGTGNDYGLIRNLYLGIVNNPGYIMAVSAVLSLYIMFTGFSYLTGNLNISQTELIVRVTKIGIISALLNSQYSWSFFNDYLFVYFIGGVQQIIGMIQSAGASGPGASSILAFMLSKQVMAKLFSLLFVEWQGFVYILMFLIALCFVIVVFLQATVIYLSALLAIGMIITMAPIFLCFMLFERTKSLFQNWLKQLISYAIQPIILFTGLTMISMILRQEIYGALGFQVCKRSFPVMNGGAGIFGSAASKIMGSDFSGSLFYWWFPMPMKPGHFSKTTVPIPVPIDHFVGQSGVADTGNSQTFCAAYACIENRYPDLPFLDPVADKRRLHQFWNGNFVQLDGFMIIIVALYLLQKFNDTAVSAAKFITGTSGNMTNISNIGHAASRQFQSGAMMAASAMASRAKKIMGFGSNPIQRAPIAAGQGRSADVAAAVGKGGAAASGAAMVAGAGTTTTSTATKPDYSNMSASTQNANKSIDNAQNLRANATKNIASANAKSNLALAAAQDARQKLATEKDPVKRAELHKQITNHVEAGNNDLANAKADISKAKTEVEQARKDLDSTNKKIDDKSNKVKELEAKLAAATDPSEKNKLQQQITDTKAEISKELKAVKEINIASNKASLDLMKQESLIASKEKALVSVERSATNDRLRELEENHKKLDPSGSPILYKDPASQEMQELKNATKAKDDKQAELVKIDKELEALDKTSPEYAAKLQEKNSVTAKLEELEQKREVAKYKAKDYSMMLPPEEQGNRAAYVTKLENLQKTSEEISARESDARSKLDSETKTMLDNVAKVEEKRLQEENIPERIKQQEDEVKKSEKVMVATYLQPGENAQEALTRLDNSTSPTDKDAAAELKKSMEEYQKSQEELEHLNKLKEDIIEETKNHADGVNAERKANGASEYVPEVLKPTRPVRKIEDFKRT